MKVSVQKALDQAKPAVSTLEMKKLLVKNSKFEMSMYNEPESLEVDIDDDNESDQDDEEDNIDTKEQEAVLSEVIQEVCCEEDPVQIDCNLQQLCKQGIVDYCKMQKLHKLKKSIAPKKVQFSAMPIYYPTRN